MWRVQVVGSSRDTLNLGMSVMVRWSMSNGAALVFHDKPKAAHEHDTQLLSCRAVKTHTLRQDSVTKAATPGW
ncbi:hypothetical protein E2C01_004067 [Portunus trituberculatus]|uniref:Uncharacterized protein n=1 Tax=Portunus trituberculatus TaxID=210409 RepID=A0A5B7CNW8_PORTR|nr:hypothetical protein [Portunus trituberculatus]